MNKYLMMVSAAAAVLAGASGATASNVKGGVIDLGNGCDLIISESQKGYYSVQYSGCGGPGISYGQGLARKTPLGRFVDLSDNYFPDPRFYMSFDISLPLKNGGTWALWAGISGTTSFLANSGTYTVGAAAKKTGGNVMAETVALIARLRAARGKL